VGGPNGGGALRGGKAWTSSSPEPQGHPESRKRGGPFAGWSGFLNRLFGRGTARRIAELEARLADLEETLGGSSSRRRMREYLGLRWAFDVHRGHQVAHCNICWHEGRELPLEVHEASDSGVVALLCHHPDHGPEGLRLVRDAGGFHWGEHRLEAARPAPAAAEASDAQQSNGDHGAASRRP
jgi:hypothetical protein